MYYLNDFLKMVVRDDTVDWTLINWRSVLEPLHHCFIGLLFKFLQISPLFQASLIFSKIQEEIIVKGIIKPHNTCQESNENDSYLNV